MSKKRERPQVDPFTLKVRRLLLGLHILLEACVILGAVGPWWQAMAGDHPIGDPVVGMARGVIESPWVGVAVGGALLAFFFASYDLVADADLQRPILACSLVVLVAAGVVFHRGYVNPATIEDIVHEVTTAELKAGAARAPGGAVAPVDSASDPLTRAPLRMQYRWGLALFVAAAPLLVVISIYLTFLAPRALEPQ